MCLILCLCLSRRPRSYKRHHTVSIIRTCCVSLLYVCVCVTGQGVTRGLRQHQQARVGGTTHRPDQYTVRRAAHQPGAGCHQRHCGRDHAKGVYVCVYVCVCACGEAWLARRHLCPMQSLAVVPECLCQPCIPLCVWVKTESLLPMVHVCVCVCVCVCVTVRASQVNLPKCKTCGAFNPQINKKGKMKLFKMWRSAKAIIKNNQMGRKIPTLMEMPKVQCVCVCVSVCVCV